MKLSITETNVLLVALDHMEEHLRDLMSRPETWERLEACKTIRTKIKEL